MVVPSPILGSKIINKATIPTTTLTGSAIVFSTENLRFLNSCISVLTMVCWFPLCVTTMVLSFAWLSYTFSFLLLTIILYFWLTSNAWWSTVL